LAPCWPALKKAEQIVRQPARSSDQAAEATTGRSLQVHCDPRQPAAIALPVEVSQKQKSGCKQPGITYVHDTFCATLMERPVAGRSRLCRAMRPGGVGRIAFWPNELRASAAWCGRSEGQPRLCRARCVLSEVGRIAFWPNELQGGFGQTNFASARPLADLRLADARCLPDVNAGSELAERHASHQRICICGHFGAKNRARKQPGVPCGRHPDSAGDR